MEFFSLLSLKEWLLVGLVAALVGYHFWDRHEAVSEAEQKIQDRITLETQKAVIAAQKEWNQKSTNLDMLTLLGHQQFEQQMSRLATNLANFKGVYHETVIHDPLPASCFASPERVRAVNQALGH